MAGADAAGRGGPAQGGLAQAGSAQGGSAQAGLRAGAIALFVAAPLLAATLAGLNVLSAVEQGERADAQEAVLAGVRRRIAAGAAGPSGRSADTSAVYLTAPSVTLAKAELQQLVGRLVEQGSGRLVEARGGDDETGQDGAAQGGGAGAERAQGGRVQLQVTMEATNESMFNILYEIETGTPLLSIEQIGIRKVASRTDAPDADPALRVTILVRGHWSAPK